MTKRTKYIHEGKFVAEVDVQLIESEDEWAPYLSVEDACKVDDVGDLLKSGQIQAAAKKAKVYLLTLVAQPR